MRTNHDPTLYTRMIDRLYEDGINPHPGLAVEAIEPAIRKAGINLAQIADKVGKRVRLVASLAISPFRGRTATPPTPAETNVEKKKPTLPSNKQ